MSGGLPWFGAGRLGAPLTSTAKLGEIEAAWALLRERIAPEKALEFSNLLLAFEVTGASGSGALYFNANHGAPKEWGVRSDTVVRVAVPLTREVKGA